MTNFQIALDSNPIHVDERWFWMSDVLKGHTTALLVEQKTKELYVTMHYIDNIL